jgi:hypothetical protein
VQLLHRLFHLHQTAAVVGALAHAGCGLDGFAGEPPTESCSYADCGGFGVASWGTIPLTPAQAQTWRADPPVLAMTFFRNGAPFPGTTVKPGWNDVRCDLATKPVGYCAAIQEPGGSCGPEPIRIDGSSPVLCPSADINGEDIPLVDGDVFRLVVLLEGRNIVDDQFVATYTNAEPPSTCENRLDLHCRFAKHRFEPLP